MELKVAFVVVCLFALAITFTEAGIPKCCITTKRDIPLQVLRKVQRWTVQQSSGACDISALLLYVRNMRKPICAHPKVKRILISLQSRVKRNKQKAAY
ncbi:C-C motif chemokine 27a [Epinephelus fuscoguttatus]|uniref:C-C motif chemokine 27a n=1 Tax=Epinephelus fuscoguttatus TaxID=293821 RepID=UPI0020D15294|nr:C-C motif chemokine 27a [Epinephelus fuscoguttatus]